MDTGFPVADERRRKKKQAHARPPIRPCGPRGATGLENGDVVSTRKLPDRPCERYRSKKVWRYAFGVGADIPTLVEMGLPISFDAWGALFAPKGTPRDIIGKLNAAVVEALADPTVQARLADLRTEMFPRERQTPEALGALMKADAEKWWPLIKEFGLKAE
jgi:hypothetical protein